MALMKAGKVFNSQLANALILSTLNKEKTNKQLSEKNT
jgi:hypothetical protein